jgi:hypothetical protein
LTNRDYNTKNQFVKTQKVLVLSLDIDPLNI